MARIEMNDVKRAEREKEEQAEGILGGVLGAEWRTPSTTQYSGQFFDGGTSFPLDTCSGDSLFPG